MHTMVDLTPYLDLDADVASLGYEAVVEVRDAARSDLLVVVDELRGVTEVAEWTVTVDDDDQLAGGFAEALVETAAEHELTMSERDWRTVYRSYGLDRFADFARDQDERVLIEEFAPDQPIQLLPTRDGAAVEYADALQALCERCEDRIGELADEPANPGFSPREVEPVPVRTNLAPPPARPFERDFIPEGPSRRHFDRRTERRWSSGQGSELMQRDRWHTGHGHPRQVLAQIGRQLDLVDGLADAEMFEAALTIRRKHPSVRRMREVTAWIAAHVTKPARPRRVLDYIDRVEALLG